MLSRTNEISYGLILYCSRTKDIVISIVLLLFILFYCSIVLLFILFYCYLEQMKLYSSVLEQRLYCYFYCSRTKAIVIYIVLLLENNGDRKVAPYWYFLTTYDWIKGTLTPSWATKEFKFQCINLSKFFGEAGWGCTSPSFTIKENIHHWWMQRNIKGLFIVKWESK